MVRETVIETHLRKCVMMRGGLCEKFTSPGKKGPPDRLVTWPDGTMQLVETKRPIGGKVSPSQRRDHQRRAQRRVHVRIVSTKGEAENYVWGEKKHWHGQILAPQCPEHLVN